MSSLAEVEKRYFEKLFDMGSGYVLYGIYNDTTYGALFKHYGIDIHHSPEFQTYSTSKANKMRSFWEQQPDGIVGKILSDMMDAYEADEELNGRKIDRPLLKKCRAIADRLLGKEEKRENRIEGINRRNFSGSGVFDSQYWKVAD